jgi:hypothetical protein
MNVYVALLHFPVYNKNKETVTTCVSGFDISDIARSCSTYGIKKYFIVNPISGQRQFAERILSHWKKDESLAFNSTRVEALDLVSVKKDLKEVVDEIGKQGTPVIVATSAKQKGSYSYGKLNEDIKKSKRPYLILLGTGWGLCEEVLDGADVILSPIEGGTKYNHLSVRSAAAIILDRIFGRTNKED